MSLGTWDPTTQTAKSSLRIDPAWLREFIALAQQDKLTDLNGALPESAIVERAGLMQLDVDDWNAACGGMDGAELLALIRFFTLAEQQLPGWHAGHKSPVIALARMLKQRGAPLSRDLQLWIRANSDNRYLPHGKVL